MISATQREALSLLTELCELSPDVRLGQSSALPVSSAAPDASTSSNPAGA